MSILTVTGTLSPAQLGVFGLVLCSLLSLVATALLVYGVILLVFLFKHQTARGDITRIRNSVVICFAFFCMWGSIVALAVLTFVIAFNGTQNLSPAGLLLALFVLPYAITSFGVLFLLVFSTAMANASASQQRSMESAMESSIEEPLLSANTVPKSYEM